MQFTPNFFPFRDFSLFKACERSWSVWESMVTASLHCENSVLCEGIRTAPQGAAFQPVTACWQRLEGSR